MWLKTHGWTWLHMRHMCKTGTDKVISRLMSVNNNLWKAMNLLALNSTQSSSIRLRRTELGHRAAHLEARGPANRRAPCTCGGTRSAVGHTAPAASAPHQTGTPSRLLGSPYIESGEKGNPSIISSCWNGLLRRTSSLRKRCSMYSILRCLLTFSGACSGSKPR